MAALFEDFPSIESNQPEILISEVLLSQQFATKASSTEDEQQPEKQIIENEVHQLRLKFEKDVGSLYSQNLKRKVLLQFKVFLQLEKLSAHREQLSYQFYYKGMIEKCLDAWKRSSYEIAEDTRILTQCFQRLARRGLVRRKAEILKDRVKFKFFIEWQRALFYSYKLKQFQNVQALKTKNNLFMKLLSSISHRKWAQKTIKRKTRNNMLWRHFVRQFQNNLKMERGVSAKEKLSRYQGISAQPAFCNSVSQGTLQNTEKILADETRAEKKEICQALDEQTEEVYSRLEKNSSAGRNQRWRESSALHARSQEKNSIHYTSQTRSVQENETHATKLDLRLFQSKQSLYQQGWRNEAKVKLFQKYRRKQRLRKVGRKAWEGLKMNRNSMKGWRVKMYYLKIMRLASYWMAWKKFRLQQRKYKKILYALFVRKGFKLFKTWRSIVPLLKQERREDQLVRQFQLCLFFKSFKKVIYQSMREKYIVLRISRRHYSNLARLSLQGLKQFKDKNIENAAMARIMQERFMEKNASLILRKWAGMALGRANKRVAIAQVKKVTRRAFSRYFFTRVIHRVFQVQQSENAREFYFSNLKGKAILAFNRNTDLARRGHVVHAGLCNRIKNEFFFLWRLIVQNQQRPLQINTDQSLGRIDSQIVISPQSFQSFSLRHLVVPQWNQYFAEAKAEEWKRQKQLRKCFRQFQLEARNNVLFRLFQAKLMRPIDSANLRAYFYAIKVQSEDQTDSFELVKKSFAALKKYTTDEQRFRLIGQTQQVREAQTVRLRLLKILSEKKKSVLRPVFIQLRIYTLRSLNLKTFLRFRNQEIVHSFFAQWLNLSRTLMQYKQTAANHFKLVLTQKLNKLRREVFGQLQFTPQRPPIFQDISIQEELMSPEFGNFTSQQREYSPPPSNTEQIPTPPKSPPIERDINIDLSKVLGNGAPSEPQLLPRSETMFDFNTNTNSSGLFSESCRFSRSCHEATDNQLLRRNTPPPLGKENIYSGYFQVYLAKHQRKSVCPTSRSSILEHSPDIVPSKNFRLCRIQSARGEYERLEN